LATQISGAVPSSESRRRAITGAGLAFGLTRPSILVFLCIGTLMHVGIAVAQGAARRHQWDFSHYYVAALAMRNGINPYTTDLRPLGQQLGLEGIARATDTPFFLLCFEPLTWLRPAPAYWIWFAINAAALALAMGLIVRTAPRLDRRQLIWLCAIVLLYPPLSNHIFFAQTQVVILLLVVVTMRSLESAHDRTAGLALAVAGLLKVFPLAIIGYFVMGRRWRALAWTAIGLVVGTAATIFAFGLERNLRFVGGTYLTRSVGFLARPANVALGSFISRMFYYATGDVATSPRLDWTRALTVGAAEVALIGLTICATLPRAAMARGDAETREGDASRSFALWVVAAIMLSPTAWIHYLVLLILPFMLIAAAGWNGSASARALWAMAASYAVIVVSMAIAGSAHSTLANRPYLKTAIEECATLSLILAYASAWCFATDAVLCSRDANTASRAHEDNEVNLCQRS
jgi:glycosyl transferase family 87